MVRQVWGERAVEAVLEFPQDAKVVCSVAAMARIGPPKGEREGG